jgi:hypothetical protein
LWVGAERASLRARVAAVVVDGGQLGDQALKVGAGPGLLTVAFRLRVP